jgi:hypothetical protein
LAQKGQRNGFDRQVAEAKYIIDDEEDFDVEDAGLGLIEERDAMDAAAESADGRGWDREDTDHPQLRMVGAALNATIKAVHVNKHVDAFDLLYALLTDRTHVIFLLFDEEATESDLYEGLLSIGYSHVGEDGEEVDLTDLQLSLGFLRMLAELGKQRHCTLVLDPFVFVLARSSHVGDIVVGPGCWTEERQIGANSVSYSHNTNGTTWPLCDRREQRGLCRRSQ